MVLLVFLLHDRSLICKFAVEKVVAGGLNTNGPFLVLSDWWWRWRRNVSFFLSLSSCLTLFSVFFSRAHYWVNKYILKNACELQRVVLYFKDVVGLVFFYANSSPYALHLLCFALFPRLSPWQPWQLGRPGKVLPLFYPLGQFQRIKTVLMCSTTPHTCIPGLVWQKHAGRFSHFELKVGELWLPIHFVCVSAALYHRGHAVTRSPFFFAQVNTVHSSTMSIFQSNIRVCGDHGQIKLLSFFVYPTQLMWTNSWNRS